MELTELIGKLSVASDEGSNPSVPESLERVRRIQCVEAMSFLTHRDNYGDPIFQEFMSGFDTGSDKEEEEDDEDFDSKDVAEGSSGKKKDQGGSDEEEDGEFDEDDDEYEDVDEPEEPLELDSLRKDFLEEVESSLVGDVWFAIQNLYPADVKVWDEKMGEEDGENYWRLQEYIPFDAPGSFFPQPRTEDEEMEREMSIVELQDDAMGGDDLDSYAKFHAEFETKNEAPMDRRSVIYYRALHAILLDPKRDLAQAIRDAFKYRMEEAQFYTSWADSFSTVRAWTLCTEEQREEFYNTFSVSEESMKKWKKHLSELKLHHNQLSFHTEFLGLRSFLIEQDLLMESMKKSRSDIEHDADFTECDICLAHIDSETDARHQLLTIESEKGPKHYGKCCYEGHLKHRDPEDDDDSFDRLYLDMYVELAEMADIPEPGNLKKAVEMMTKYIETLPAKPEIPISGSETAEYAALLHRPAERVLESLANESITSVRKHLMDIRILGYYTAYDRLKAFADRNVQEYQKAAQLMADVRALLGLWLTRYQVLAAFREVDDDEEEDDEE